MSEPTRNGYIQGLIDVASRGRPWFANKVALVFWPGYVDQFEKVKYSEFRVYVFATHLEAGFFIDMHPPKWSYITVTRAIPMVDITRLEFR